MTTQRFRGMAKEKRDSWVRQMAIDMPHLSQQEIADKFGLNQATVSRILKSQCTDCQQDKDRCPDCANGNLYVSPDKIKEE